MEKLLYYKDLILVLTHKEIKVRYKNSVLGYLWSVANPLAFALVFFIIFKVVARLPVEDYPIFLITGLFPWQCFSNSVTSSPGIYLNNSSLIKKMCFPRNILPLVTVLQDIVHLVLAIPVIVMFLLIFHKSPHVIWLAGIPILLLIQLFLTYGITLTISAVNLFFRDVQRLTEIFIVFVFYFTPIFYSVDMIPGQFHHLIFMHPVAPLMISWRNLLLNNDLQWQYVLTALAYSLLSLFIGLSINRKLSWRFAEVL